MPLPMPFIPPGAGSFGTPFAGRDGAGLAGKYVFGTPQERGEIVARQLQAQYAARQKALMIPQSQQSEAPLWGARIDMNDVNDRATPGSARSISDLYAGG